VKITACRSCFARPRTPNDNPFIESAFSTVKRAPEYPGRFLDDDQAVAYFNRYFTWYDTEHYHSGIDYVTRNKLTRACGGKSWRNDAVKNFLSAAGAEKKTKSGKPAHENKQQQKMTASLVA